MAVFSVLSLFFAVVCRFLRKVSVNHVRFVMPYRDKPGSRPIGNNVVH